MIISSILIVLFSASLGYFLTAIMIPLAKRWDLVDDASMRPHPATTHVGRIPRAGGLPIFLAFAIPVLVLFPLNAEIIAMLSGGLLLISVGIWDDKQSRSPYIRFLTNAIAAALAVSSGIIIPYITNPLGGILLLNTWQITIPGMGMETIFVWAAGFAFCWILWNTNIIGWSGGIDGQLPGVVSISAGVIGLLSLKYAAQDPEQWLVTYLSFALSGAFLGFLPWNFYPQRIMPGYGGKTFAGFMLAVLSILAFGKLGTAILILAIPIIDACFVFTRRILTGNSPVWATSGHLHHHLLSRGWGKRRIAFFYWGVSLIAGTIALSMNSKQKFFAGVLVFVLIFGFILWVNLARRPKE